MSFRARSVDKVVDTLSNQIMAKILKRPFAAFGTKLAYVHKTGRGKSVIRLGQVNGVVAAKGTSFPVVSFKRSLNKEPVFNPKGTHLVFTSHIRFNKDLYITKIGSGAIHRISARKGVNHAIAFSPKGNTMAATLSHRGNPDIYLLRSDYRTKKKWRVIKTITRHHSIDTSPAFSPDGKRIAFVSARRGRAQIL